METGTKDSVMEDKMLSLRLAALPFRIPAGFSEEEDGPVEPSLASTEDSVIDLEGYRVHTALNPSIPADATQQSGYYYGISYADSTDGTCNVPIAGSVYVLNACTPATDNIHSGNYMTTIAGTDATTPTTLYIMWKYYTDSVCTKLSSTSSLYKVTDYGKCSGKVKQGITTTPSTIMPSSGLTFRYSC
jgi:hypothetical protein